MKRILVIGGKGYVGSRLVPHLQKAGHYCYVYDLVDGHDYAELDKRFIQKFDAIVLLAAHSSVSMCEKDPHGSWINNVQNFQHLINKIGNEKFIYASSASVYNGLERAGWEGDSLNPPMAYYDMHKQAIDEIARLSGKKYFGLRFGTVCGLSPNPRLELVVNSMFIDARILDKITVSNPENMRAVLGLGDLCRAIDAIIKDDDAIPGFYNLCSFNMSIGNIARCIAQLYESEIVVVPGTSTYSFAMETGKIKCEFNFEFKDTLNSICYELRGLQVWDKSVYNRNKPIEYPKCTKKSQSV